jgi:hypothetical protein
MATVINTAFVQKAIQQPHTNIKVYKEIANRLQIHADGKMPDRLIKKRRPNESEETFEYRKQIYVPRTQEAISKVLNSLSKIRRSQDWNIQYDNSVKPLKSIANGETLQDYCEFNYPQFSSITNWCFAELLKINLLDANSLCAVVVKSIPPLNEYIKPEIEIFTSEQIIDFAAGDYYILKSNDVVTHYVSGQKAYNNAIYWAITATQIIRYEQLQNGNLVEMLNYTHNIGIPPVQKVGGLFSERKNNDIIQISRIDSMCPFLDEAAREYSDLQAEIVQHIYSEKFVYSNTECPQCKGSGTVKENGKMIECKKCSGHGRLISSPYGVYVFDAPQIGEQALPNRPVDYIQKSTAIAEFLDRHIENHIYKALSCLNMEFLAKSPIAQSGIAKEFDENELNNFVNSVAEDLVMVLDKMYYFINEYRYRIAVPDKEKRLELLPTIAVPERFGLVNSSYLMAEIQTAKNGKVNPVLVKNMEIEYARKKYNAQPEIAAELQTIFELDPLYGYEQQEKMTMLSNGGITESDYVISCNITQFVQRAAEENSNFFNLAFTDKKKIIAPYAEEIIKINSEKEQISANINFNSQEE